MARIYIASSYTRMKEAVSLAMRLKEKGHVVRARWLEGPPPPAAPYLQPDEAMEKYASEDLKDLFAAEALVCITGDTETRGGRHTELGIALATGMRVILYGPREQLFHWHPAVRVTANLAQLLEVLK